MNLNFLHYFGLVLLAIAASTLNCSAKNLATTIIMKPVRGMRIIDKNPVPKKLIPIA